MTTNVKLPDPDYLSVIEPGGVKKIKSENRRSDSTYLVDPRTLHVDPNYNVRVRTEDYLAYIRELADDMKAEGYDPGQPITAVVARVDGNDVLVVRAGNTRREAAILAMEEGAPFEHVPVIIRPKTENQVDQTVDLVRSNNGRPLKVYELAIVVKRLSKMELSEAEIARRLALTPSYVGGLSLLAAAPHKLAMLVVHDKVAAAVAIDLIRKHGHEKALEKIEASLQKAQAQGKKRVTPAMLPDAAYKKAVKTKAPALLETATLIRQDAAFGQLSSETRERLSALLDELEALKSASGDALGEVGSGEADVQAELSEERKAA